MAETTTIDEITAGAIRRALASAAAGHLSEACASAERALSEGGEPASLHAMLGMLRCSSGDLERGVEHLRSAHAVRPGDPVIVRNLATTLGQLGHYQEGLGIITDDLVRLDKSYQLLKLRAFLTSGIAVR